MQNVKIKIVKIDTTNEGQTESLSDCGLAVGDVVLAELLSDGDAVVKSSHFEGAKWDGWVFLAPEEFEVVRD